MSYSDIVSDGGMDPRHRLEESMNRHAVEEQAAVLREVEFWRKRHDALLEMLAKNASMHANPPIMLVAHAESYEAGRVKGKADAAEELREECAQVVEAMGMQGYGTLAIAAAIRKELMK